MTLAAFLVVIALWLIAGKLSDIRNELRKANEREDKKEIARIAEESTKLYEARHSSGDEFIPDGLYKEAWMKNP